MKPVRYYLICYDIADPNRLQRVHRLVSRNAISVQYSVFLGRFAPKELQRFVAELSALIHPRKDDIRIYPVLPNSAVTLGAPLLPDGLLLPGIPLYHPSPPPTPTSTKDDPSVTPPTEPSLPSSIDA